MTIVQPKTRVRPVLFLLGALAAPAAGCGPTPEESFDEFIEKTEDDRPEAGEGEEGMLAEIDGQYLFALESVVDPAYPLQFLVDSDIEIAADGLTATLTLNFQPLSLDPQCLLGPRQPVGETILLEDLPVGPEGTFFADLGEQMVTGDANPITGSDITATLALNGVIQSEDFWCGTVEGEVTSPIQSPLDNSTFAAIRVSGIDDLPELFPTRCPGPEGDDGTREEVPEC